MLRANLNKRYQMKLTKTIRKQLELKSLIEALEDNGLGFIRLKTSNYIIHSYGDSATLVDEILKRDTAEIYVSATMKTNGPRAGFCFHLRKTLASLFWSTSPQRTNCLLRCLTFGVRPPTGIRLAFR